MMDSEDFQRHDAMMDQKLAEAIEAVNQLEDLIREGFKDTDAKIKQLTANTNAPSNSQAEPESAP